MLAVMAAIQATIGAILACMGGATQAHAGPFMNNAAIKKTETSNQWNYDQAKSSKQNLAELALALALALVAEDKKPACKHEIERYKKDRAEIKRGAEKLEAEATNWVKQSVEPLHLPHRRAQATTALQVSIARWPPSRC